jgi:hypothetical protein
MKKCLRSLDKAAQAIVGLSSATSFGILVAFQQTNWVKPTAAVLSLLAFLASSLLPRLAITHRVENLHDRELAWANAVQQIENAMRFTKSHPGEDGEVRGYVRAAEDAYNRAFALHSEHPKKKLVKQLADDIRLAFPPKYVWRSL